MFKGQLIALEYPVNPVPRYGYGKPAHPELLRILQRNEANYANMLKHFLGYHASLTHIAKLPNQAEPTEPAWVNGWLPGLDSLSIYCFLSLNNPQRYYEIGSGNSTKFARRAIQEQGLQTKITSFDPFPRAEIDGLCDQVIRKPVEEVDPAVFSELTAGDILFVDNSHRSFTNSDVTVVFLEILPRLKPGVLVEFHDILLPYDYPPDWQARFYNEQYLLACYLLAEGNRIEVLLPNAFISKHQGLSQILAPIWTDPAMQGVETHGSSFWIRMK